MTLSSEMTRISTAFGAAHVVRSGEIAKIAPALRRQLDEGNASLRRASAKLTASIESDLKEISRQVSSTRSAALAMAKRYASERQIAAKGLRTKLENQRNALGLQVGKSMGALNQDRTGAAQIWRQYTRGRNKQVSPAAPVNTKPFTAPSASVSTPASTFATTPAVGGTIGAATLKK